MNDNIYLSNLNYNILLYNIFILYQSNHIYNMRVMRPRAATHGIIMVDRAIL